MKTQDELQALAINLLQGETTVHRLTDDGLICVLIVADPRSHEMAVMSSCMDKQGPRLLLRAAETLHAAIKDFTGGTAQH